jgi:acyl carrier protein
VQLYVLDKRRQPVPIGITGEIYVGGVGVGRGYINLPALTQESFLPDHLGRSAEGRLYRTGDLGRWNSNGMLEYLGRSDLQVKIRGFRIELGEIESHLRQHPAVREAAVLVREDAPGAKRLVAYYTSAEGEAATAEALRAHLAHSLPGYMVPAAYVPMAAMPLTPNGKLDRRALPAPQGDAYGRREYEVPIGEIEVALAKVWSEVLGIDRISRSDNFFDLGGHSLLVVRLLSGVSDAFRIEPPMATLFVHPTLRTMAAALGEARQRIQVDAIRPIPDRPQSACAVPPLRQ